MQKKHAKFPKLVLCLILTILLSMTFVACNGGVFDAENGGNLKPNIIGPKPTSYVCIDINPSIEMVLDQNDIVLSVASANDDGLIMLWDEDGIVGANLQVAIKKITRLAVDYGYLNENNNIINISASTIAKFIDEDDKDKDKDKTDKNSDDADANASNGDNAENVGEEVVDIPSPEELAKDGLIKNIELAIEFSFKQEERGFDIVIENGVDVALSFELDQLKALNPDDEDLMNMDVETYRLVKRAMANDARLSPEKAISLGKEQLLSLVSDEQSNATNKLGKNFETAQSFAQFEYESQKQALVDNLYSSYFIDQLNTAQNFGDAFDLIAKIGYATQYSMLRSAHISLTHYATYLHEFLSNPIYDAEAVQVIFDSISSCIANIDYNSFVQKVCDDDGFATRENIIAYINGLYRKCSTEERTAFYLAYGNINDTLERLTAVPEEKVTDIETSLKRLVDDSLSSISIQLGDMLDAIKNCLPNIDYNNIDSVNEAIEAIDESVSRTYVNMRLTADDFDLIAQMHATISDDLDELKKALNDQITNAKTSAIQTLDEKKGSLRKSYQE